MSLIINHNLSALSTQRNLSISNSSMSKSIEKLSSGYKINVGADDPSGLIISEQLRSQISGLERAVRNSSEAFNLIGIAEGALNEMNSILKKMRALAIHAANNGITSPEQVAADQAEMDSGIQTLDRIANTTRYSDQYLLNGQKQLVYDVNTVVNEPTDHSLLDIKMTRVDQVFKRDGMKISIGFTGEESKYKANTENSAQRAYLEADSAYTQSQISGANVTEKQEFILTGTGGSRLFSFKKGTHIGEIVSAINNVRDSTGIGSTLTFASDVRIDQSVNGIREGGAPDYGPPPVPATGIGGYSSGTYVYQNGDVQIYGAGLNNEATAKIESVTLTPDAAAAFKVGFNCDGDGKIYAKVIDKATNSIEYYKDKDCTMLIGTGDDEFFAAANNSEIPSSPMQNLDGLFITLNTDNAENLDVYEIAVVGQRLDNMKDLHVDGLAGWADPDSSIMSGVELGVNTSSEGSLFFKYTPVNYENDGKTVRTFKVEVFTHSSYEPQYLVATSGNVLNNLNIPIDADPSQTPPYLGQVGGQTVRIEEYNGSGLNITINLPKPGMIEGAMENVARDIYTSGSANYDAAFVAIRDAYTSGVAGLETIMTSGVTLNAADLTVFETALLASGATVSLAKDLQSVMLKAFEEYYEKGLTTPAVGAYILQQAQASNAYRQISAVSAGATTAANTFITAFNANFTNAAGTGAATYGGAGGAYDTYKTAKQAYDDYMLTGAGSNLLNAEVAKQMPKGIEKGGVDFTNLGMRVYAVDYGSAETISIQNNAGSLFYYYREPDSMEKVMIEPEDKVQVKGQDATVSLNGAPVYTTGLVANTTTPDFSGSLVFNAGKLGLTTLAVAGYETGKLYSRATTIQGVEENEASISQNARHFEPPALSVTMGNGAAGTGLLDKTGSPINLYLDFSQLDPTVEVKINNLDNPADIKLSYAADGRLTIDARALGTDLVVTLPVKPENLEDGFYVTDPALKGLFIKTDKLIDPTKTTQAYAAPDSTITATGGNIMLEVNTYATNPRGNTSEKVENFKGGMQFQLGNTEGDQDRTIYSVQSMAMSNLGRIEWDGEEYCLQNVLGGGSASLSKDPVLAMRIIAQAVDDVSTLRARLGAFQSNMLQTNINSLEVAIENITKTEAAIRDTDMASESTEFTRSQIMQQAGTSMLAQANQVTQNVLSLLQ